MTFFLFFVHPLSPFSLTLSLKEKRRREYAETTAHAFSPSFYFFCFCFSSSSSSSSSSDSNIFFSQLRKLDVARDIMSEFSSSAAESPSDIQFKWKQLGDLALLCGEMELSKDCAQKAGDLSGLLLMYSAYGDRDAMNELVQQARDAGKFNVAFAAAYILGDVNLCVDMLLEIGRVPEAALFSRTYVPSRISEVVQIWKKQLSNISDVLSQSLADPDDHSEGFPDLDLALQAEQIYRDAFPTRGPNANNYSAYVAERESLMNEAGVIDVLALLQNGDSLVSGPGFGGTASSSASKKVVSSKAASLASPAPPAAKEETPATPTDDDDLLNNNDDDDDLLDDDEEEEAPTAPAASAPAVVVAPVEFAEEKAPVPTPTPPTPALLTPTPTPTPAEDDDDFDDDDLDDLLNDDDDLGEDGGDMSKDEDIDLDDLDLDDDDEWS